ncbi:hypothetical protein ANN_18801 [Periplaneta americana]|uniref:Uncharacterized protein n=1 Tax=Periplaneta americana TaxID=6978 RepID=A0ABQ8SR23_PERAM|nr:hypothetical protein ANN_18801 [Periplaneta americana]
MSPGSSTKSYAAFAHIWLRENPGKNLNQVTCPDRESNPGHLVSRPDALTVTPQVWTGNEDTIFSVQSSIENGCLHFSRVSRHGNVLWGGSRKRKKSSPHVRTTVSKQKSPSPHNVCSTLPDDGSLRLRRISGRLRRHPFSIDDYTELKGKGIEQQQTFSECIGLHISVSSVSEINPGGNDPLLEAAMAFLGKEVKLGDPIHGFTMRVRLQRFLTLELPKYKPDLLFFRKTKPFSLMKYRKNKARLRLTNSHLQDYLCIATSHFSLGVTEILSNIQVQGYHYPVILPVVLYGCETWTLTLRDEQRLRVFKNKVLRKILGAKREEVTGEWRKLHNTELHALYSSPDIIRNIKSRRLRWAGHVARMAESRNAYSVLVERPEEKRPLGRPRRRWEDNIKMDLREAGYDDRDWINLAQGRDRWWAYVRATMNLRVP